MSHGAHSLNMAARGRLQLSEVTDLSQYHRTRQVRFTADLILAGRQVRCVPTKRTRPCGPTSGPYPRARSASAEFTWRLPAFL
jgi:hypothetical protein